MSNRSKKLRYQTYHGVAIPPFKEDKIGAGSTTIRFVITGKIPSKKNQQQAVTIRKIARDYLRELQRQKGQITFDDAQRAISKCHSKMRGNKLYNDFLKVTKPVLQKQMQSWSSSLQEKGLIFPITKATMHLRFYWNNRYITDTVNKQQTIQDLLVDCGVIANDDYNSLNPIVSASACYADELVESIAFVSLSFKL